MFISFPLPVTTKTNLSQRFDDVRNTRWRAGDLSAELLLLLLLLCDIKFTAAAETTVERPAHGLLLLLLLLQCVCRKTSIIYVGLYIYILIETTVFIASIPTAIRPGVTETHLEI